MMVKSYPQRARSARGGYDLAIISRPINSYGPRLNRYITYLSYTPYVGTFTQKIAEKKFRTKNYAQNNFTQKITYNKLHTQNFTQKKFAQKIFAQFCKKKFCTKNSAHKNLHKKFHAKNSA